ncbi:MAG: hypothetical protein Q8R92_20845 [Deltaproteobacteria bacterium]|nr:hypothetical protein [Deltaproteobacteria bacterium]
MEFFKAGSAIILSGYPVGSPHLWFVLTDPDSESDQVVAVMVVTVRGHTDRTVTLSAGDHPFIRHDSSLDFGGTKRFQTARLNAALRSGRCELSENMTAALLGKVRAGLLASPRTPHHIIDYCRDRFPKDFTPEGQA